MYASKSEGFFFDLKGMKKREKLIQIDLEFAVSLNVGTHLDELYSKYCMCKRAEAEQQSIQIILMKGKGY